MTFQATTAKNPQPRMGMREEKTRIFFTYTDFHKVSDIHAMHRTLHMEGLENFEVFLMAGKVGIDCRTPDLMKVAAIMTELDLI